MSTENPIIRTRLAGADLSAAQYQFVKLNASGQVVLAGAGEEVYGVLYNKPTSGQAAMIATDGVAWVKAAGVIAPGARVASNASGLATTAAAGTVNTSDAGATGDPTVGSNVFGIAQNTANTAANQIFPVLITRAGLIPSTAA